MRAQRELIKTSPLWKFPPQNPTIMRPLTDHHTWSTQIPPPSAQSPFPEGVTRVTTSRQ